MIIKISLDGGGGGVKKPYIVVNVLKISEIDITIGRKISKITIRVMKIV